MKDKRAVIFYLISTLMLWQLGITLGKLAVDEYTRIMSEDSPLLSFVHLKNTGGAFSLFEGSVPILGIIGIITLLAITFYVIKKVKFEEKFKVLSIVLFSAGVLGNTIERLTLGFVVDYIKLNFINFAVFNFYDVMITLGFIVFVTQIILSEIIKLCKK